MNKLLAAWNVFRKGQVVANPTAWKNGQITGSIAIRKEGKEVIATKDSGAFNLVANEWHEIEALKDGTVFVNIFAEGKY